MGEARKEALRVGFDSQIKLEFHMAPAAMIQGDALRRLQETRPESLLGVQANVPHPPGRPENLENGIGAMGGRWYNNGARSGGVAGRGQMGNVG